MKNLLPVLWGVAAFAVCLAFAFLVPNFSEGAALAAFIPLMPRNLFSGRSLVNRAIRLDDGTWGMGGEVLHYPVYDRMRMLNSQAVQTRSLFKNAVGTQREGTNLTYADTNVEKSESVPYSQKWTFWKLTNWYIAEEVRTDVEIIAILSYYRTTTFRLIISSKDDMFRLPLWKFMGSPQLVSAPAATINSSYPQALFTASWELKVPIVLQSLTDWEVRVEPLVASAVGLDNDFVAFEFDGERVRKD
jgi:hypothetical protein